MAASSNRWRYFVSRSKFQEKMDAETKDRQYEAEKRRTSIIEQENKKEEEENRGEENNEDSEDIALGSEMGDAQGEYKLHHTLHELKRENKKLNQDLTSSRRDAADFKEKWRGSENRMKATFKDGSCITNDFGETLVVLRKEKYEEKIDKLKEIQQLWMFSQKELMASREDAEVLEGNIKNLEKSLVMSEGTVEQLKGCKLGLEKEKSALEQSLQNEKAQTVSVEKNMMDSTRKFEEEIKSLQKAMEELIHKHTLEVSQVNSRYNSMEIEKDGEIKQLEGSIERIESTLKCTEGRISKLEALVKSKDDMIVELDHFNAELQKSLEILNKEIFQKESNLEEIRSRVTGLRKDRKKMVAKHHEERQGLREQIEVREQEKKMARIEIHELMEKLRRAEGRRKWK